MIPEKSSMPTHRHTHERILMIPEKSSMPTHRHTHEMKCVTGCGGLRVTGCALLRHGVAGIAGAWERELHSSAFYERKKPITLRKGG